MAFTMTSETHGIITVCREREHDDLILVFGPKIEDSRKPFIMRHALTEHEGYTEVTVPYLNTLRASIHDEHVDRARAMRDRLDNDTAFLQWLDTLAKNQ